MSRCNIEHAVSRVTRGDRKTMVFFLCDHVGHNRRKDRRASVIEERTAAAAERT
jgi:hypothetical protein